MRNSPFAVILLLAGGLVASMVAYHLTGVYVSASNGLPSVAVADASGTPPIFGGPAPATADDASDVPPSRPYMPQQVIANMAAASTHIYLLDSRAAHRHALPSGESYKAFVDEWRNYFDDRRLKYTELQDADLNPDLRPGVLILPSAAALSAAQRAAIAEFEKRGGSVLATWITGSKDGEGRAAGYGFLQEQFGIRVSGEITRHDKEEFVVAAGDTPVASTLPSGSRMWLGLTEMPDHPLRVSGGAHVAARFMNWDRTADSEVADEAVVYTETGPSRRVYFAFPESVWQFDQANVYLLVDDVMNWLQRRPRAYLANWPYPYRAAQIVEMDTEQGFPNAANLEQLFDAYGFHGTFYCVSSIAQLYPDTIRRLEKNHEIAFHGDVHDGFQGQPRAVQSKRFDTMRLEMTPLVAIPAGLRGFRPPYELWDKVSESLLYQKGFGHILGSDDPDTMLPSLSTESPHDFRKGLIVLPRTQPDDMNFKKENYDAPRMAQAMDDAFDLAREFGGLGVLSVHTQNFEVGSPVEQATRKLFQHMKVAGSKTWIAPSGTIEQWWRNRALFKAHLAGDSRRIAVNVTVARPGMRWPVALVVSNTAKGVEPTVRAARRGMPRVQLAAVDEYQTALVFESLAPGHYRYYLKFAPPAAGRQEGSAQKRTPALATR